MAWPGNCLPASSLASPLLFATGDCVTKDPSPPPSTLPLPTGPLPLPHSSLLRLFFLPCCFSELFSVFGCFTSSSLSVRGNHGGRGGEASRTHQWGEGWASLLSPHSSPRGASLLMCGLCPDIQSTPAQDWQELSLQLEVAPKVSHPGQQGCASMPCRQHCGGGGLTRLPWPAGACPGSSCQPHLVPSCFLSLVSPFSLTVREPISYQ